MQFIKIALPELEQLYACEVSSMIANTRIAADASSYEDQEQSEVPVEEEEANLLETAWAERKATLLDEMAVEVGRG